MKRGLLKVLADVAILILMLVVMDVLVGWVGEKYINRLNKEPRNSDAALVNYDVNAAAPDVAILGSSTAICHYDPQIIHDSLLHYTGRNLEVFNMGVSNQRLAYDYYGLRCLLVRTTPQLVIADIWPSYIGEGDMSFSFEAFRPYVSINPIIKEMLEKHGDYSFMNLSNMYCYNTEFVKLLMAPLKAKNPDGFSRSKVKIEKVEKLNEKDKSALSDLSIYEFMDMIRLSKERGFKLIFVMSPTLRSADTESQSYQFIVKECHENDILMLDYSNDESYYKTEYFRDRSHLNYYGAELFSQNLMSDLKYYIQAQIK